MDTSSLMGEGFLAGGAFRMYCFMGKDALRSSSASLSPGESRRVVHRPAFRVYLRSHSENH